MAHAHKPPFYVAGSIDMELIGTLIDLVKDGEIPDEVCWEMVLNGLETLQASLLGAGLDHVLLQIEADKRLAEGTVERLKEHLSRGSDPAA